MQWSPSFVMVAYCSCLCLVVARNRASLYCVLSERCVVGLSLPGRKCLLTRISKVTFKLLSLKILLFIYLWMETGSLVASNSQSLILNLDLPHLPSARVAGMCHHAWLICQFFWVFVSFSFATAEQIPICILFSCMESLKFQQC